MLEAIFFDLDGTLVDTAADFHVVLNRVLATYGRPPLSYQMVRAHVSDGARALIRLGFGLEPDDDGFQLRLDALLDGYAEHLSVHSDLFVGVAATLDWLDREHLPWGIVTNKPVRYTVPLLQGLGLTERVGPVVCPEHVAARKPDPEGLLMAARAVGARPGVCLYIGDHLRDIQAGRNAGMITATAAFGYIDENDDPKAWRADHFLTYSKDLLPLLQTLTADQI